MPYVVDNDVHRLADVLNAILAEHGGRSLDVATAYFNVPGFRLLQKIVCKLYGLTDEEIAIVEAGTRAGPGGDIDRS